MSEHVQIFSHLLNVVNCDLTRIIAIREIDSDNPVDFIWDEVFDALVAMGEG